MAKTRKKIDTHPGQKSLFALLDEIRQAEQASQDEGSMLVRERLRVALSSALKNCSLSRWEVAGKMSHLLGCEITKFQLDAWTAESKDGHRFPAEYLPAFCRVTGDRQPLALLAEAAGLFAMPGPDALRSEIQKLDEEVKRISLEKRKRLQFLKEMEIGETRCGKR